MSGSFSMENQDYIVSNMRFCNLLEWAIEVSEEVKHEKKRDYIDKMKYNYENKYSPITDINMHEEFDEEEKKFWAEVFMLVGVWLFQMKLGNPEYTDWRPSAIGDAMYINRMLKGFTGIPEIHQNA